MSKVRLTLENYLRIKDVTKTERESLYLAMKGMTHREIALQRGLSIQHIKNQFWTVNRKLGFKNKFQFLAWCATIQGKPLNFKHPKVKFIEVDTTTHQGKLQLLHIFGAGKWQVAMLPAQDPCHETNTRK